MSADLGVGDWVERVGSKSRPDRPVGPCDYVQPEFGHVYCVTKVGLAIDFRGEASPSIQLAEFRDGQWWPAECFRPIRSDITEIERLLTVPVEASTKQPETVG